MTQVIKPMLASPVELINVRFPVLASPKLNGVRCLMINGVATSRSGKPLPNKFIQQWAKDNRLHGIDGEIIVGSETDSQALNNTTSGVMSIEGQPDFTYWVFDSFIDHSLPYNDRISWVELFANEQTIRMVSQKLVNNEQELIAYEKENLAKGYEGTMLRDPNGPYKFGRSSVKQGYLLKRKLFVDDEFEIIGYVPRYENQNQSYRNELGYLTKSTAQDNLVALDELGAFVCVTKDGEKFNVGTGFTDGQRKSMWYLRDTYIGQLAKVKYFPEGMQKVPLLPVFLSIRNPIDL